MLLYSLQAKRMLNQKFQERSNMKKTLLAGAIAALALFGCSTDEVNYDRYSLVEDVAPDVFDAGYDITLSVNEALNEGGVVLKTSEVTLRSAVNHRWTSDIKEQLAMLIADSLNRYSVSKKLSFKVYISQFYGSTSGETFVKFNVNVTKKGKVILSKEYSATSKQEHDGYPALVSKLKEDFTGLTEKLAQELSLR